MKYSPRSVWAWRFLGLVDAPAVERLARRCQFHPCRSWLRFWMSADAFATGRGFVPDNVRDFVSDNVSDTLRISAARPAWVSLPLVRPKNLEKVQSRGITSESGLTHRVR